MNKNAYLITENKLLIGENEVLFDYPIRDSLEIGEMLIVRLEKPFKTIYNENVFGIQLSEKKIKWQIAKKEYREKDCPFIGISLFANQVKLFNWCGFYLIVNPITGEILKESERSKY